MTFIIDPHTVIGWLTLAVRDLEHMSQFYRNVIGLNELTRRDRQIDLGVNGDVLVKLQSIPDGKRHPHSPGLFHMAIRLPGRRELAQWFNHLLQAQYPLDGAGDHLVSEALYLTDPEGNGIEMYYDRPPERWESDENGIKMDTLAVDLKSLQADAPDQPFNQLPAGTTLGHIHLQVNNVEKAVEFYRDVMGFQLMAQWPGAGFLSAGGYHHHIGVNMWNSKNASPPPPDSLGLVNYSVQLAGRKPLNLLLEQLDKMQQPVEQNDGKYYVQDPSRNKIVLTISEN
jgi:catechol 2,3-dioxygenase